MQSSRFYILGCQRSGTTLLRLVLDSHPQIQCLDEPAAFAALRGFASSQKPLVGLKLPQITEQLRDEYVRDDAAIRSSGAGVKHDYSGQSVLFMIRDVRDTVASMLTLNGWLEHLGGTVLDAKIRSSPEFATRYGAEIERMQRSTTAQKAARAALIWRYKVDALFDYVEASYPVLPIWYESLVRAPEAELLRVCGSLRVPWSSELLRHHAVTHAGLKPDGRAIGNTDPKRPIDTESVGRWQSVLSDEDVKVVLDIAGAAQRRLYAPGSDATRAVGAYA